MASFTVQGSCITPALKPSDAKPPFTSLACQLMRCCFARTAPPSPPAASRDRFRGEPLSPGCISLFVRGGDKAAESAVFTAQHYEGMVKRLRQIDPALTNQVSCWLRAVLAQGVRCQRINQDVAVLAAVFCCAFCLCICARKQTVLLRPHCCPCT
jgi:hypothetical protein